MSELLVRIVDKVNDADPYLNAKCTKRGDVIVVVEDGWAWGGKEKANPEWRIVKLPKVTVSEAQAFLSPEPITDPAAPNRVKQRRAFRLNLDTLPLDCAYMDYAQLSAYRVAVQPLDEPDVL